MSEKKLQMDEGENWGVPFTLDEENMSRYKIHVLILFHQLQLFHLILVQNQPILEKMSEKMSHFNSGLVQTYIDPPPSVDLDTLSPA